MATGSATIRVMAEADRDLIDTWEEGDLCYVPGTGLTIFDGEDWQQVAYITDIP